MCQWGIYCASDKQLLANPQIAAFLAASLEKRGGKRAPTRSIWRRTPRRRRRSAPGVYLALIGGDQHPNQGPRRAPGPGPNLCRLFVSGTPWKPIPPPSPLHPAIKEPHWVGTNNLTAVGGQGGGGPVCVWGEGGAVFNP